MTANRIKFEIHPLDRATRPIDACRGGLVHEAGPRPAAPPESPERQEPATIPPTLPQDLLARNLDAVRARIRAAAERAGRDPSTVRLVAVTKSVDAATAHALAALGARDLGENRVQDGLAKIEALGPGPTWHLIGHLQSNKARRAVAAFDWIHSIDSVELLARVDQVAAELGRRPRILLQVNVSGEASKSGVAPEELPALVAAARAATAALPVGLMTMAPLADDPEASRPILRALRALRDELRARGDVDEGFTELSMGMTNDFEVAIEEGATLVRVGRALFAPAGEGA